MRRDHDVIVTDPLIRDRRAEALYRAHQNMAGRWVPPALRWVDVMPQVKPFLSCVEVARKARKEAR